MRARAGVLTMAMVVLLAYAGNAQFKSQVKEERRVADGITSPSAPSLLFGWFNPDRFHMRHSFHLSYMTFGGRGLSLGTYTNSMSYEFAENLNARADLSLSYSPYNSFSTLNNKDDLSSLYLSRAQLNYKPWENALIRLEYQQVPFGPYYSSPFYNPWYRENGF